MHSCSRWTSVPRLQSCDACCDPRVDLSSPPGTITVSRRDVLRRSTIDRPHLQTARFDVLAYEETEDWHRRMFETTDALLDHVEELAAEAAADVEEMRTRLKEMRATLDAISRRVLVVASAR